MIEYQKIKICFIVSVDITIKLILLNYLRRFKKAGYDVHIVCSEGNGLEDIRKEGFNVKTIEITRRITPFSDFLSFLKLAYFLRREKFDIVQAQTPKAVFIGQMSAKLAGVPIIINNNFGFYFQNFAPFKKKVFVSLERISARCSDLMFVINKEDIQTAVRERIFKPEKIKYLGFGIDTNRFNPDRFSADSIRKKKAELGIGGNRKVAGIVARLVREKGYQELFKAFKVVIGEFPDALLLIAGIEELEKKDRVDITDAKIYGIENNIKFLGERNDIDELYPLMDVYVLPSHREGLGNTILEASASEKPVIASDIRGCREAVDSNKTGILVPPQDPEELAKAIIYLFNNPEIGRRFGKEGRKKIKEQFGEQMVFSNMEREYQRLIKEKL